jgi:hypothetical protein
MATVGFRALRMQMPWIGRDPSAFHLSVLKQQFMSLHVLMIEEWQARKDFKYGLLHHA